MKLRESLSVSWLFIFLLLFSALLKGSMTDRSCPIKVMGRRRLKTILIDDFSSGILNKQPGTKWELVSDRVMGGVSAGRVEFKEHDGHLCLYLTGYVSMKNNGGFIQARFHLGSKDRNYNAHTLTGVRLHVKGNEKPYAIHLRTKDTHLPWQFYQAQFQTNGKWQEIRIPFSLFRPYSLKSTLDTKALRSIAVVAIGREFNADIFVDEIAFYGDQNMCKELIPEEECVIVHGGTEAPFSGKYYDHFEKGVYVCKRCGAKLFDSSSKFSFWCGWPSFDDQIKGAVRRQRDSDGIRIEVVCTNCGVHLGHAFFGERLTRKNIRYCVNSVSLDFISEEKSPTKRAIFASGCFWGTEYHFQRARGVISTTVGYTGGHVDNPTYIQVCTAKTGHAESVEVIYDPSEITYEQLAKLFFETHDFTQLDRRGPDIGKQYRSAVFYLDEQQREIAAKLVEVIKHRGYDVKTEITPAGEFWPAEEYHQDYYKKTGNPPYCHMRKKIF